MSLSASLANILKQVRKTAKEREQQVRHLPSETAQERLKAITGEIGQTLLPRVLTFENGNNAHLTIDAGSRRVLKVLDVQPSGLLREGDTLFTGRDDSQRDEQLTSLSHMLTLFASIDGNLRVLSAPPQELYGADEVGYTSDELESACKKLNLPNETIIDLLEAALTNVDAADPSVQGDTDPPPSVPILDGVPEKISVFFQSIQRRSNVAFLVAPSGDVLQSVPDPFDGDLLDIKDEILGMLDRWSTETSSVLSGQKLIVMRSQAADGNSVAFFMHEGHCIISSFKNKDLGRVFSSWAQVSST
ncbi:hypothetical protein [Pseudaestuariivita rosea]|uniref:hypothetical protein n=1 Tax=Pseudaestuariivita rosea TaxID=2763263 RepID=UPI001ABA6F06|nr:hypothetical protein [Pseudaestuariivita rosea]